MNIWMSFQTNNTNTIVIAGANNKVTPMKKELTTLINPVCDGLVIIKNSFAK
jgi:hypothetical protein